MNWTTSCKDWERRIVNGESLIPCDPLFPDYAEYALSVFKQLRVYDVPGQPTMGECCREWVFDLVRAVFGAYDQESGRRLITEFLLHISKKNTKSTIAAGLMLTAVIINWRDGAEFLILAPTIEVAGNSYVPARWMIKLDDDLNALFHVQDHIRTITHRENGTAMKVVAADKDTVSGKKATGVLIDELWLFGEKPNAENMLTEATGGLASRPEGFVAYLTTQSDKPPAGIFAKKLEYGRGVRDGRIDDPAFMPILYEFPPAMVESKAYELPENFYVTNPNLGLSVDVPFLERKARMAEEDGEESLQGFRAKHLNVQVGTVLRSERWTGADYWDACDGQMTLDDIIERSEVIVAGVDGGGLDDLLGFAVIGREKETGNWLLWNRAWCDPVALERRKSEADRYRDFARADEMAIVPIGRDIDELCEIISKIEASGLLDRIAVDPLGLGGIVDGITDTGIDHERVVGIPQGYKLSGAIQTTARKCAEGTLIHGGQSLMQWCVSNARVEKKGNADIVTKQASGTGKIDPLVATFCAVALMALNPEPRGGRSVYEDRGMLVI